MRAGSSVGVMVWRLKRYHQASLFFLNNSGTYLLSKCHSELTPFLAFLVLCRRGSILFRLIGNLRSLPLFHFAKNIVSILWAIDQQMITGEPLNTDLMLSSHRKYVARRIIT